MKITIEIELEIEDISYTKAEKGGYYCGPTGSEIDWTIAKLIVGDAEFNCPAGFSELFYDEILEEYENEQKNNF